MKAKDPVRRVTARLRAPDEAPHCLMSDASIFIGLTSIPFAEGKEFVQEMDKFFENYHKTLTLKNPEAAKSEFRALFYRPKHYLMFAPFDLAILALTDDYQFGVQSFSPVDPVGSAQERDFRSLRNPEERNPLAPADKRSFYYKILLGPSPRFNDKEGVGLGPESYLVGQWRRTIAGPDSPPLIGIIQVELNSSFSVGAGGTFLRCAMKAFRTKFDQLFRFERTAQGGWKGRAHVSSRLVVLESFGWPDLTLLVFSESFADIARYMMAIREITVAQMGRLLQEAGQMPGMARRETWGGDWRQFLDRPTFLDVCLSPGGRLLSSAQRDVLCRRIDDRNVRRFESISPLGCHIIFNTTSMLGFDAGLLAQAPAGLNRISDSDRIYAFSRWSSRPGHTLLGYDELKGSCRCRRESNKPTWLFLAGRSDLLHPCRLVGDAQPDADPCLDGPGVWLALGAMSSQQVVERSICQHRAVRKALKGDPEHRMLSLREHPVGSLTAADTILGFDPAEISESGEKAVAPGPRPLPKGHSSVQKCRLRHVWGVGRVKSIYRSLRKLRVPKVTADRVYNAIALFNEGTQDEFLFSNFIELSPYLERIRQTIQWFETAPGGFGVDDVTRAIDEQVDIFEQGWRNRFHASWRQGDVSDYNLEFKGAIQHLASGFHGAFRNLSWMLSQQRRVLAVIGGRSSVSIQHGAVSLNVHDLFMPEFFIARAAHEAFETLLGSMAAGWSPRQDALAGSQIARLLTLGTDSAADRAAKQSSVSAAVSSYASTPRMGKLLLDIVNPKFFNQVLADMCNFNVVFFADPDLYSFFWRVSFIADPHSWRADGNINAAQLTEALLRLMLVLNDGVAVFQTDKVRAAVAKYWQTDLPGLPVDDVALLIRKLVDELAGLGRAWPVLQFWQSDAANFLKNDLCLPDRRVSRFEAQLSSSVRAGRLTPPNRDLLAGILRCRPRVFKQALTTRIFTARGFLEQGRCCVAGMHRRLLEPEYIPPLVDGWFDFVDTIVVFHAYLQLLKDQCLDGDGRPIDILLPLRHDSGSTDTDRLLSRAGWLYYSPRGGSFTNELDLRRQYLRWRNAVIMSLWDISEQGKLREWRD